MRNCYLFLNLKLFILLFLVQLFFFNLNLNLSNFYFSVFSKELDLVLIDIERMHAKNNHKLSLF